MWGNIFNAADIKIGLEISGIKFNVILMTR
jgi:hypothetical protein